MSKTVLIIGAHPSLIDFSAPNAPPLSAEKVMDGLNASRDRLNSLGHDARILLTGEASTIEAEVSKALKERQADVIVIGAGLRTLPPMAEHFERLINVLHRLAPHSKLAFNSRPDDSDVAALRHL
jgi:hypothetical protein